MPSPTIIELYDFDTQIEDAVAAVLVAGLAGVTPALVAQVNVSRDSATLATPRIDVEFTRGPAILQYGAVGQADPRQVPVAYHGTITILISTTRPNDNALMTPVHGPLRGAVSYFLSAGAKVFTSSNLPWLQILEMLPAQGQRLTQQNKEQDVDALTFAVKFAINQSSWPATA